MAESYTLREVAELLGVSKRTLQRRIREGAFPGRFLAPGRHGLETRVPAEDVRRVLDEMRREPRPEPESRLGSRFGDDDYSERGEPREESLRPRGFRAPEDWSETLVPAPLGAPGAGPPRELEAWTKAVAEALREEREVFFGELRELLEDRDEALSAMRLQLGAVLEGLDGLKARVEQLGAPERPRRPRGRDAVEAVLADIEELERLLGRSRN